MIFDRIAKTILNHDKVYILPTGYGLAMCGANIVVLLAAGSYTNNLAYLLAFILFTILMLSLVQTHFNFTGTQIEVADIEGGHVGGDVRVKVIVRNNSSEPAFGLHVKLKADSQISEYSVLDKVDARSSAQLVVNLPAPSRGQFELSLAKFGSNFPLGLWWTWSTAKVDRKYYVYPAMVGDQALPDSLLGIDDRGAVAVSGGEDFSGHKSFVPGESMRHIDWRAAARTNNLLVKKFDDGNPGLRILDWDQVVATSVEGKLSQMAKWTVEMARTPDPFGVLMPGWQAAPDRGPRFEKKCLEKMAVYGIEDSKS